MSMPLLRCREVMPYLSAYVDGELDAQLRGQVETHMASCPRCSQEVTRYQAIDGLLLSLPGSSPSPEVLDHILASTSSQNKEKAIRQSLRQPERDLAPRSVPAFLVADTNLATPIPMLLQRGRTRRSWILATGLPTLAAVLIISMSLVFFHVRTENSKDVVTPTPATNIEYVTRNRVDDLASQLSFTPVTPTLYPSVIAVKSASVGRFSDGRKYLDVVWTLRAPLATLHLREVKGTLADRVHYDYVQSPLNSLLTWTLPSNLQSSPQSSPQSTLRWQPMGPSEGSSGDMIVGADFSGFSVTLDIAAQEGSSSSTSNSAAQELTTLRLVSLSMSPGITYQALSTISPPDSRSVLHYQILTTGVRDGRSYTWDVYLNNLRGLAKATLSDGSGALYTDYMNGAQWRRCYPDSSCVALLTQPATDPLPLGNKAVNFFFNINADIQNGELWNLGIESAPSALGIGQELVYALAYVGGPYPMTVYVSRTRVVIGVISTIGSRAPAPGGPSADSPLSLPTSSVRPCSSAVAYPVIAYLPVNSSESPLLTAPEQPARGNEVNPSSIATCQQSQS